MNGFDVMAAERDVLRLKFQHVCGQSCGTVPLLLLAQVSFQYKEACHDIMPGMRRSAILTPPRSAKHEMAPRLQHRLKDGAVGGTQPQ